MDNILCTAILDTDVRKKPLFYVLKQKYSADIYFNKVNQQQLLVVVLQLDLLVYLTIYLLQYNKFC